MNIFNRDEFKMTRSGIIPKVFWNGLVDLVWALAVVNVDGGRMMRSKSGTSLSFRSVPGGAGVVEDCYSLKVGRSRPAFIPEPEVAAELGEGEFEVWVEIGVVNGVLIENRMESVVVDSEDCYVALKVSLSQGSKNLVVSKVEIESSGDEDAFQNAPWVDQELSQTLPEYVYVYLAHVHQESGVITNYGKGSVSLSVGVANHFFDADLTTRFTREIREVRLG